MTKFSRRTALKGAAAAAVAVAAATPARSAAQPTRLRLSYYPWITQSISGTELAAAIAVFRDLLQEALRGGMGNALQIDLQKEMKIPDQLKDMKEKPAGDVAGKIGLLNPIGYALVHAEVPEVEAVAVVRRKIGTEVGPTYKAQLYTHSKTAIKKVREARGRSMAFGSPQSTSNFLMPAVMLWEHGVHPLNGFARVAFTGGHDKAAGAVYKRELDVGAGHDGVISDLASKPGSEDAEKVLVRIAWSDPIPSDPVAIHTSDPAVRDQVVKALLQIAGPNDRESDGNKAVKSFWGTNEGFETISPDAYLPLLRLMHPLGLRPDDLLRKV
jgi:ABC-type phosphate/phosphonate transport system substrate-binding protein